MKNINNLILVVPEKFDEEREEVAEAWKRLGGKVQRIGKFWCPPQLDTNRVKLYGNHIFCMVLMQKYNLKLISPDDDLLVKISERWSKRKLKIEDLSNTSNLTYPIFIKPLVPKLFTAKQYANYNELCEECRQLDGSTKVMISEIISIVSEARAFILNGHIMSLALYEGNNDLDLAKDFLEEFINENISLLPKTCVIDLGYIIDKGWCIIEFNAVWGAGLNGCVANEVVECLIEATEQSDVAGT